MFVRLFAFTKMELFSKNFLALSVLVLLPLVRGGCKEDLAQNPGAAECFTNYGKFLQNLETSGTDMSDPTGMIEAMCSPEGKEALKCVFGFTKDCPELMATNGNGTENPFAALQSIPGLDMESFMKEGGLDGACALMVGPCSKVKDCYTISTGPMDHGSMDHSSHSMVKRGVMQSANYYLMFQSQSSMMCGQMKEQMTCMVNALESCPESIVSVVEAEFEKAINISTPDSHSFTSFQDTKAFIQKECPKMPKDFLQDTCLKSVILSLNFSECNENITMAYSKEKTCEVYNLNKQCVMDYVKPHCGEETSMFLARNSHMIFPGIPKDCDKRDTSGSDVNKTSFAMLLLSAIMTFLLFL